MQNLECNARLVSLPNKRVIVRMECPENLQAIASFFDELPLVELDRYEQLLKSKTGIGLQASGVNFRNDLHANDVSLADDEVEIYDPISSVVISHAQLLDLFAEFKRAAKQLNSKTR